MQIRITKLHKTWKTKLFYFKRKIKRQPTIIKNPIQIKHNKTKLKPKPSLILTINNNRISIKTTSTNYSLQKCKANPPKINSHPTKPNTKFNPVKRNSLPTTI